MTDPREIAAEGTTMITQADREADVKWLVQLPRDDFERVLRFVIAAAERSAKAEREGVVKWLRDPKWVLRCAHVIHGSVTEMCADAIAAGEHLPD